MIKSFFAQCGHALFACGDIQPELPAAGSAGLFKHIIGVYKGLAVKAQHLTAYGVHIADVAGPVGAKTDLKQTAGIAGFETVNLLGGVARVVYRCLDGGSDGDYIVIHISCNLSFFVFRKGFPLSDGYMIQNNSKKRINHRNNGILILFTIFNDFKCCFNIHF